MDAILTPAETVELTLEVNGQAVTATIPVRRLLADFLRDELGLTGTHVGCEQGVCGACTVLLDGEPARSCITLAVQVHGRSVTTVEGITPAEGLGPLQEAFKEHHALQCGFCTPGFLMTISGVDPAGYPDEASIRELLSGNLCRCTGYEHILAATRAYFDRVTGDAPPGEARAGEGRA
jgi:carbon-monoxide dehydrogenase small subunit